MLRFRQAAFAALLLLALMASVLTTTAYAEADGQLYSPSSIWNAPLSDTAPLDPNTVRLSAALAAEARLEGQNKTGPWIQTSSYSTPIYVVPAGQPTLPVALDDSSGTRMGLALAFAAVPIPPGARPAQGGDGHMTVWQPSTDHLWEFWHARQDTSGWHATWGGANGYVSRDVGYYNPFSWVGARWDWGATASSLPLAAGVMRISELRAGHIDHALAVNLPYPRRGVWAFPAQRTDGTGDDPNSLPEGAHLRLDPRLDLSTLSLPPMARMMAEAAQKYGIVVRDQTHHAIGFFAEDPLGLSPYYGTTGFFGGKDPNQLLAMFPWERLQLLRMDLRSG